jgi:CRP-like cAMP-binding protein
MFLSVIEALRQSQGNCTTEETSDEEFKLLRSYGTNFSLSPEDWEFLLTSARQEFNPLIVTFSRGDAVLVAEQKYNMFGLLMEGSCRVNFGPSHALIGQGEIIGEVPFLTGKSPTVTLIACEDNTRVRIIDGDFLTADVATLHPFVAAKFFRYLSSSLSSRFSKL